MGLKLTSFCTVKETIKNKQKKKNKKTTYRMGENSCKQCNWQKLNLQNIQTTHTTQQQQQKKKKRERKRDLDFWN